MKAGAHISALAFIINLMRTDRMDPYGGVEEVASRSVEEEITAIAKKYADLVKKEMNVEAVYLFGSFVNGNHNQDSDIDIAVITDDLSGDIIEDTLKLMRIRRKIDTRIEPHPLRKDNSFVKEVIATGRRIG
jgi:predicted nucleotidyltransferase